MATTTPGRRTLIGTIGAGMAMVAVSVLASPAAAAANPAPYSGNPSCTDLGLSGVKINAQPTNDTYDTSDLVKEGVVPASLEIAISNVTPTSTMVSFDWHATTVDGDFPIDVVLVKFANGGLRWSYAQPGQSADHAWATQDSISHVSFCFDSNTGSTDSTDSSDTNADSTDSSDSSDSTDNQVLGETVTRDAAAAPQTLPVTGSEDLSLTIAGVTLIGLGSAGLVLSARLRRSQGTHYA